MPDRKKDIERRGEVHLQERSEEKLKKPPMYKVLLHNDDYTPMYWVVGILKGIFHKNDAEAERVMFQVHTSGVAIAGIYTHEIAETKVAQVVALAQRDEYPLMPSMEPE